MVFTVRKQLEAQPIWCLIECPDETRPGAYPIVLATYEIVCSKYPDPQVGAAVKAFLQSTIGDGRNGLAGNGYIPVPASFKSRPAESINAIS